MIRTFLEFLLSRSLDSSQPDKRRAPAAWLQRQVQRDDQLKQFDTEARQLDALLRRSAAEHRQFLAARPMSVDAGVSDFGVGDFRVGGSGATNRGVALLTLPPERQDMITTARVHTSGLSVAWLTGLAAAAVLLLVASPSWSPNWFRPSTPAVHAGEFSRQLTVVPGEVLWLITRAAETSRTRLPQLSPLANLSLPTLPAWEELADRAGSPMFQEPLRREIDSWQESWQNFKVRLVALPQQL